MREKGYLTVVDLYNEMRELQEHGLNVSAILFGEEAELFMRLALSNLKMGVSILEYDNPSCDYYKEYIVTLAADDYFSIEKLYRNGKYLTVEADAIYIDGDASSKLLPDDTLESKKWTEISFASDTDSYVTLNAMLDALQKAYENN